MNPNTRYFDHTMPYRVVPMRHEREDRAAHLARAMNVGLTARRDPGRPDFYMADVDGILYYFHVFEKNGTAYLIAGQRAAREVESEQVLLTH